MEAFEAFVLGDVVAAEAARLPLDACGRVCALPVSVTPGGSARALCLISYPKSKAERSCHAPAEFVKEVHTAIRRMSDASPSPSSPGADAAESCSTDGEVAESADSLLIKGSWTAEEDDKLRQLVDHFGPTKWSNIAAQLPGRVGKQCRERWFNHLDDTVNHTKFSCREDLILAVAHSRLGNQWSQISTLLADSGFAGRTSNAVKNHWNSTLFRVVKELHKKGIYADRYTEDHFLYKCRSRRPLTADGVIPGKRRRILHVRKPSTESESSTYSAESMSPSSAAAAASSSVCAIHRVSRPPPLEIVSAEFSAESLPRKDSFVMDASAASGDDIPLQTPMFDVTASWADMRPLCSPLSAGATGVSASAGGGEGLTFVAADADGPQPAPSFAPPFLEDTTLSVAEFSTTPLPLETLRWRSTDEL